MFTESTLETDPSTSPLTKDMGVVEPSMNNDVQSVQEEQPKNGMHFSLTRHAEQTSITNKV